MTIDQELFKKLIEICGVKQPVLEILGVYHGLKKACRIVTNEKQFTALQDVLGGSLCFSLQDYKILTISDKGKMGFVNKMASLPLDHPEGNLIVYLAKEEKRARLAKLSEKRDDVKAFGKVLGYPDCCIDFYMDHKEAQEKIQMDFIIPAGKDLKVFPFANNYCLRYFDLSLLCHFPCRFDCECSKIQGEAFAGLIRQYDPAWAVDIERALKSFVLYTEYDGVFYCPDYTFADNVISYKQNIVGTQKNWIFDILGGNDSIECTSCNQFKIGGRLFENAGMIAMFA